MDEFTFPQANSASSRNRDNSVQASAAPTYDALDSPTNRECASSSTYALGKRGGRMEITRDGSRRFAAMRIACQARYLTEIREFSEDEYNFLFSQDKYLAKLFA